MLQTSHNHQYQCLQYLILRNGQISFHFEVYLRTLRTRVGEVTNFAQLKVTNFTLLKLYITN